MNFDLHEARAFLAQTPATLATMLGALPDAWLNATEGEGTWSPRDVLAHLADLEDTDWLVRARVIVKEGTAHPFDPIDRERFRKLFADATLTQLLAAFTERRARNLRDLALLVPNAERLQVRGRHPEFGDVTLEQLLATWVVHDLTHVAQMVRVMAKRYDADVGPWKAYLGVLSRA